MKVSQAAQGEGVLPAQAGDSEQSGGLRDSFAKNGHGIFFGAQALGAAGIIASGVATGNPARTLTGIFSTARNTAWFGYSAKYIPGIRRLALEDAVPLFALLAMGSNVPQLMGAVAGGVLLETVAAGLAVAAYGLRSIPGFFRAGGLAWDRINQIDDAVVSGNRVINGFLTRLPPVMLGLRAAFQLADGINRQDPGATAAGSAYIFGAIALYAAERRLARETAEKKAAGPAPS